MNETMTLAEFSAASDLATVPDDVLRRLKLSILDSFGAAIYGFGMRWSSVIREFFATSGGHPQSAVWNTSILLPVAEAAFVNSVATHAFELDDRRIASYMHPASGAVPAALATADAAGGADGQTLLSAIVAGYEVGLRVGKCVSPGAFARGYYPPGIGGAFAAAASAARIRGLNAQETSHVFALAATQAAGLYSPTMVKRFNLGRGTYNGVLAVELVRAGFETVDDIFEREVGGFCAAYSDRADVALLVDGLGEHYEIAHVEHKPYVSSRPNHTAIDATIELRAANPSVEIEDIENISITIGTVNYRYGAGFPVVGVPSALMSVAYCAAVAFVDGDVFLEQFTDAKVADERCRALLARTEVSIDPNIDALSEEERDQTTVAWLLKDGRRLEVTLTYAKGHPSNPLQEDEIIAKFRRLTDGRIAPERADALIEATLSLEAVDSDTLGALLCGDDVRMPSMSGSGR